MEKATQDSSLKPLVSSQPQKAYAAGSSLQISKVPPQCSIVMQMPVPTGPQEAINSVQVKLVSILKSPNVTIQYILYLQKLCGYC